LGAAPLPEQRKLVIQVPDYSIFPPIRVLAEMRHHCGALGRFSDAFEGLVLSETAQLCKTGPLTWVVQQITAKDPDQIRFCDER
jgi:hypothetical protein